MSARGSAPRRRGLAGEEGSTRRVVDQRGIPGLRKGALACGRPETGNFPPVWRGDEARVSGRDFCLRFRAAAMELGMVLDRPNTRQGHGYLGSATKTGIRRAVRSWYSA